MNGMDVENLQTDVHGEVTAAKMYVIGTVLTLELLKAGYKKATQEITVDDQQPLMNTFSFKLDIVYVRFAYHFIDTFLKTTKIFHRPLKT